jgi:6-phosphofructo-2-kinase / fructose-2,6-biphosphatase 2
LLFLESYCDDPDVITANIKLKVSSGDPDYAHMSREEAEADFRKRIAAYESVYETLDEKNLSYCKIFNVGKQVTINRINGYLQSRIAFYLMNLHLKPRSIYLSRHGESMYNVAGLIGGDSPLSKRGEKYAAALPELILKNVGDAPLTVSSRFGLLLLLPTMLTTTPYVRCGRQHCSVRRQLVASCRIQRRLGSHWTSWMPVFATV